MLRVICTRMVGPYEDFFVICNDKKTLELIQEKDPRIIPQANMHANIQKLPEDKSAIAKLEEVVDWLKGTLSLDGKHEYVRTNLAVLNSLEKFLEERKEE